MKMTEPTAKQRAIALNEMDPEDAAELLYALDRSQPTPAAVALDHLMSEQDAAQIE
ncbi:MAG: hypothetical protein WAU68_14970 [Vitreimonas sp.]